MYVRRYKVIRIKITPMGCYVVGDGDCPFETDEFMRIMSKRIADASAAGLHEIGVDDDEIQQLLDARHVAIDSAIDGTEVITVGTDKMTADELANVVSVRMMDGV
jgi:hypothetical protein